MTGETIDAARAFVDRHGFLSWLDVSVTSVGDGEAVLTVPDSGKLRNVDGETVDPIHGGVLATLVDSVSGFALRTTFADPGEARLTTTDLNVSYLRPATGDLRASGEVVRAGGSMGVVDVSVTAARNDHNDVADGAGVVGADGLDGEAGERDEVAVGRATYRLFRGEQ